MNLFVFGLGYTALRFARNRPDWRVSGTVRAPESATALRREGIAAFVFDGSRIDPGLREALGRAEALLISIPPAEGVDPAADAFEADVLAARDLKRILYLSTVGVYGGADGGWVDERSPTPTRNARAVARVAAESRWVDLGEKRATPVDVLRLAGIYGPERNALQKIRDRTARRIVKPGQVFNRIHVDDISGVIDALLARGGLGGVWNVADLEPAPPQDVIAYAAELLGVPPPDEEPYETAGMTAMARAFYSDNRRVSVAKLQIELGYRWRFPTYREGLRALLGDA